MQTISGSEPRPRFAPGFRISTLDIIVLIIGGIAAIALGLRVWWWGYVVAMVVGHFFLFCNVFRISRMLELAWAVAFVGLAGGTVVAEWPGWIATTIAALFVTTSLIVVDMCKPSYHGVWWERINPNLKAWWEAKHGLTSHR
jgi:hypothetical protein